MKKIYLLRLFLMLALFAEAQTKTSVKINWVAKTSYETSVDKFNIPQFDMESFEFNSYSKSITYRKTITSDVLRENAEITIDNQNWETITEQELGDVDKNSIQENFEYQFHVSKSRELYYGYLSFSPIIKKGNVFQRLVSFDYAIKQNNQKLINNNNITTISNSVLATGDWYRFYVEKSGVYRISRSFLQSLGMNTNVDPRTIKIYGNGGRMVPLQNSATYPYDLEENAIQLIGENDGSFDSQDFILMYAEGVDNWSQENYTNLNLYSNRSYYYVTAGGNFGKRIQEASQPTQSPDVTITTFDDYQFHEIDRENIARLGRVWFGEQFSITPSREFTFNFPNLVTTQPLQFAVHVASASSGTTNFKVEVNSQLLGQTNMSPIFVNSSTVAFDYTFRNPIQVSSPEVKVKVTYDNSGIPTSKAYLDFINIKAKRELKGFGKQFRFQHDASATTLGVGSYQVSNASEISQVWDITDISNISKIENSSQNQITFSANLGELRKYIAVVPGDYFSPLRESKSRVENQNIKGTIFQNQAGQFQDIDYLIITPKFLVSSAEKLANFHRTNSQMSVRVVTLENIYHEFSSGKQDIGAIRNLVKYVYFNASTPEKRVKYVNLFGDGSFDFKDRIPNNTNIVPTYQSLNSYTESESSFATDDFYGLMDSNEGRIDYITNSGFWLLDIRGVDIAVGRMIVSTPQQADQMVNKVIEYHDIKSYGNWRNYYVAIADDPNPEKPGDKQLQYFQNRLADRIVAQKPFINAKKILIDAYVQETSAGGNRYPKAREEILESFERGALVFNYLGHGGEDGLTEERIWQKSDGENMSNRYKYPLFITITCDFSKFDNPFRPTAGEFTYWNPKGGAISMITTVRSIGQGPAQFFNDKLAEYLFSFGSNTYTSIAESLRMAKNFSPNSATNVVFYLGDPALMLAIPKQKVMLTHVNDMPVSGPIDDLKALSMIKMKGEIQDENNASLSNYNGELFVNVFDKNIIRNTLRNDFEDAIINDQFQTAPTMPFMTLGETIFRGKASVTNGIFEFQFVVPRDIRIPLGNGRVSFYGKRGQINLDKTGVNTDIKVGGINTNAPADNIGPQVRLYMNDETFVNGGITNDSPFLLALLQDENGINTASGIGHDIVGILDGDESNPYIMNDYYQTELNDFTKGRVYFPLKNLSPGLHTLTFKAWDVYNNPVTAEIQFVVVGDESIKLTNVLNYPNPFVSYTEFWFSHNKPFEPLEVQVQVLTITGKIVWTKNQIVTTEGFLSRDITWDGKDDFGDRIGKGVYVYKLTVRSTLSNKRAEKIEKLVIL